MAFSMYVLHFSMYSLVGNSTSQRIRVPVAYPEIRAVHVSAAAWADDELRSGVMRLIDEGRINAVQLDIKDELGIIGYDSDVDLANEIGADRAIYDAREALDTLQDDIRRFNGNISISQGRKIGRCGDAGKRCLCIGCINLALLYQSRKTFSNTALTTLDLGVRYVL